jgi:hypothetical protein
MSPMRGKRNISTEVDDHDVVLGRHVRVMLARVRGHAYLSVHVVVVP